MASRACQAAPDARPFPLPLVAPGGGPAPRRPGRGRRRALVLLSVHALVAAHVTHYMLRGRTLSPVEPSETAYALELGYVNAGAIFFAVAGLCTLAFGRFFCGWGCHLVALQDLCAWLLRRLGVRPRPFRSRLLALAPAVLAGYVFLWPSLLRLFAPGRVPPFPGFSNHLVTSEFWRTFPGPAISVVTFFVCGFAAVYFLGAKGFCTYGCPYGAVFGVLDRVSPGRIVVSDACEQCGHCTAACTSNVRVHEEVKLYGMVVDPGCMKCRDCVSVCPKQALSFGYARPPLRARVRRVYELTPAGELLAAAVFAATTLAFRGLYDGPPLLLSVGLGGVTAYLTYKLTRLLRDPDVRLHNFTLKSGGRLRRAGRAFAGVALAWLAFTAHSGYVQWHRALGRYYVDRTEVTWAELTAGPPRPPAFSPHGRGAAESALTHLTVADRWGLVGVTEVKLGLAWVRVLRAEPDAAESCLRSAVALRPESPEVHNRLIEFLKWQGHAPEAIDALLAKIARVPPYAGDHFQLAELLITAGRAGEAAAEYEHCLRLAPQSAEARYNLGALLRRLGKPEQAAAQLELARELMPEDAQTCLELGLAYAAAEDYTRAVACLRRANELGPGDADTRRQLATILNELATKPGP